MAKRIPKLAWGSWQLNADSMKLAFKPNGEMIYEVPIDEFCDSSGILYSIFEINRKPTSTAKVMRDFLNSIDDLVFPQVSVCFNRENNNIDPRALVDAYMRSGPDKINKLCKLMKRNKAENN